MGVHRSNHESAPGQTQEHHSGRGERQTEGMTDVRRSRVGNLCEVHENVELSHTWLGLDYERRVPPAPITHTRCVNEARTWASELISATRVCESSDCESAQVAHGSK